VATMEDCYKNFSAKIKHKAQLGNGGVTGVGPSTWRDLRTLKVKATNRCYMPTCTNAAAGQTTIGFVSQHKFSGYEPI
jgi:hypothetical protein